MKTVIPFRWGRVVPFERVGCLSRSNFWGPVLVEGGKKLREYLLRSWKTRWIVNVRGWIPANGRAGLGVEDSYLAGCRPYDL
jgi:hypothetical protein